MISRVIYWTYKWIFPVFSGIIDYRFYSLIQIVKGEQISWEKLFMNNY